MELLIVGLLMKIDPANKTFWQTYDEQVRAGYVLKAVPCNTEADLSVPGIRIKSPNGKNYICNKLLAPE